MKKTKSISVFCVIMFFELAILFLAGCNRSSIINPNQDTSQSIEASISSQDSIVNETILYIIAAGVGAIITYFSQPLIEKRLTRIRIAEKITDLRINALDEMWKIVAELDKSRSFHDEEICSWFTNRHPFFSPYFQQIGFIIQPKIFLSNADFRIYANRFSEKFVQLSSILDKDLVSKLQLQVGHSW